ncbi:glutamate racemase [Fusibacter tunisiensis]|uniref:Glutamate racemase n=1 Tax=Fusibacter tunisiensis TaxID=1008308 RepID=A0ABS2MP70_9FIRM|nr:glutamate racemase [Fusibacter tunisiensis]MBM7561211.1 glutamate racemase [Fusibacter tunisiensis]
MDKYSKIGVFDSGLGGLSVADMIRTILPAEDLIYIGDSLHAPYGIKTKEEVVQLSENVCNQLLTEDVKAIVIACNTATSAAADRLRAKYNLPIIGMEPAIKPALLNTKGRVLVLATEMTLKEQKFNALAEMFDEAHRLLRLPVPEWVELVENALWQQEHVKQVVTSVLDRIKVPVEAVVLGCTHFIFLKPYIEAYYSGHVKIFDGNEGTVQHLKNVLIQRDMLNDHTEWGCLSIENTKGADYRIKSENLVAWLEKERQNEFKS